MSPFLAQVQVINVANAPTATAAVLAPPEPPGSESSLAELRANVAKIRANAAAIESAAKAKAAADIEKARQSTAKIAADSDSRDKDSDRDNDGAGDTTIRSGTSSVVIHHKKSNDENAGFVVPCVAIFFVFSWLIVKAVMAPFSQKIASRRAGGMTPRSAGQSLTEDEQAILLKLQRTLVQMERRVESLETILIDQTRNKEKYGTKL